MPRIKARKKPPEKVHDRRASELPKDAQVVPVEVDDPYERGAKIIAFKSIRGDPLSYMRAREQIDEAQYAAGKKMQEFYELSQIGGGKGYEIKEKVDGGRLGEPLTEQVQKAIQQVIRLERILGQEGSSIARHILCHGFSIKQCAEMRNMIGEWYVRYIGTRFREVLETLATELNFVGGNRSG